MATPAWTPDPPTVERANLTATMRRLGFEEYADLYQWSIRDRAGFWKDVIAQLGIEFERDPDAVLAGSAVDPLWLPGGRLNIVTSCLAGDVDRPAVVYRREGELVRMTRGELARGVRRFASGFERAGFRPGDRVGIAMTMNIEAVVAYLGTVLAGGVVVSIADSFSPPEIETRLRLTDPVAVVTQGRIERAGKSLPMFTKVVAAGAQRCIVVGSDEMDLRDADSSWEEFQGDPEVEAVIRDTAAHTNILFSSGTTGEPKAIPWSQITPLKAATDGRFHQDVHAHDVVAWPTNLGWMMGPWLIYAALLNGAALALYDDAPTGRGFTEFVAEAGVTILGVVPALVASWRASGALDGIDWDDVRVLSSTGEASNPGDYRWLMERVGAPVIEYMGGTEIGGGYLTATVLEPAVPSQFTTPTLGLDIRILDEKGAPTDNGELWIVPPSIGLSTELVNRDHGAAYYEDAPVVDVPLRRHGDQIQRLDSGNFRALGRVDDTMNLGGIKVSSAELERAVSGQDGIAEVAAVAVAPSGGGADRLVVFVVPEPEEVLDEARLRDEMQAAIRSELNPLFKVHDVVIVESLPRTASHKVMRRELRAGYSP